MLPKSCITLKTIQFVSAKAVVDFSFVCCSKKQQTPAIPLDRIKEHGQKSLPPGFPLRKYSPTCGLCSLICGIVATLQSQKAQIQERAWIQPNYGGTLSKLEILL